jgi:hypothetical protein
MKREKKKGLVSFDRRFLIFFFFLNFTEEKNENENLLAIYRRFFFIHVH